MTGRRGEAGFTLAELLIVVAVMAMIAAGLASVFVTGWNTAQQAGARTQESNEAELINTWLARDAQAAGGTDPATQTVDTSVGVSTLDDASCPNPAPGTTLILRFSWYDRTSTLDVATQDYNVVKKVANYFYAPALNELIRTTCASPQEPPSPSMSVGPPSSQVLARSMASVDNIVCTDPSHPVQAVHSACTGLPYEVWLTLTATNASNNTSPAYTYTLAASLRADQPPAGGVTGAASLPPLLVLGSRCVSADHAVLDTTGNGDITVNGDVYVNAPPPGCNSLNATDVNFHPTQSFAQQCPSTGLNNCSQLAVSLPDPYAGLPTPPGVPAACTGTNQPPSNGVYPAGVYPQLVSVSDTESFASGGTFIFCQGVSLSGHAHVTGTNVLWYFQGGTLNVSGQSDLQLTAPVSGPYAGLLIWQPKANTTSPMSITGQGHISLQGTIYAPSIEVDVAGNGTTPLIEALVAGAIGVPGNGNVGIGIPITSPTSLRNWTVNRPYPSATFVTSGGQAPYTWSASGLPAGLTIDPATGVLSGTPTATGTANAVITVTDTTALSGLRRYTFTINPNPVISPIALPSWTVNRNYPGTALTVNAGTGTGPFTWSATGLPAGLSINAANGVVSGTPTATGTANATFTVTDAAGATSTQNAAVTINSPPAITGPGSLQPSTQNVAYPATTIVAGQGTPPYAWSASGLPSGMTINAGTGTISGTPTTANTFNPTITVTDAAGATATATYLLRINNSVSISTTALPDWTINMPNYSTGVSSGGGTPPYTWNAVGLASGLGINSATGTISGTPTSLCSPCAVNVTVRDAVGATTSHAYNMNVNATPTITGPSTLQPWTVNRAYPGTTITGSAGTPNYVWSATGLPSGMSINAATGVISGTPTATCSPPCTVTVKLTDAANAVASRDYSLVINAAPNITTTGLPSWDQNLAYSTTVSAAGGTGNAYTWSASGLPAGLAMNSTTGLISGTPTSAGSFTVTLTAADSAGATGSTTLTLFLAAPPSIVGPASLPASTVNVPYPTTTVTGAGGTSPLSFSATGLPAGLTFTAGGVISGTPTTSGTFASVNVTITDALGSRFTRTYTMTINPPPTVATTTLVNGRVGAAYNASLVGTGGTGTYTWTSTSLPAGLTLNPNTGAITGTPTAVGTTNVAFTITDSVGASTTADLSITVTPYALKLTNVTGSHGGPLVCDPRSDNYACTWSSGVNGATLTANVAFSDASGNLVVDSATVPATISLSAPAKGTIDATTLTVPAGQTTTNASFTLTMSGKNAAVTTITFGTLTIVLTLDN
jgi:prepilin-type N-terminal cleavage/methylation domain-containing protein